MYYTWEKFLFNLIRTTIEIYILIPDMLMNEYINPFFCCHILRLGGLKEMKLFYECLRMYEQI